MINFWDIIKSIYTKKKIDINEVESFSNIGLVKYLSFDKDNLLSLSRIAEFSYYIAQDSLFYLIWLSIPYKANTPYLKVYNRNIEVEDNELYKKIQYILNWSNRELDYNKNILNKVIDNSIWNKKLGLK